MIESSPNGDLDLCLPCETDRSEADGIVRFRERDLSLGFVLTPPFLRRKSNNQGIFRAVIGNTEIFWAFLEFGSKLACRRLRQKLTVGLKNCSAQTAMISLM